MYYEGSSSFGGQQARNQDVPQAAAVLSQLAGAPVRLQHMRWDETGWGTYSPGLLVDIKGGVDTNGNLVAYDTAAFYPLYKSSTPFDTTEELLGKAIPPQSVSGWYYPATMYTIPNQRYILKSVPILNAWLKVQWNRSGSSPHMAFASEQMIDELAHAAGIDPVAFELQNITAGTNASLPAADAQISSTLLPLIEAVTTAANWQPKVAASNLSGANTVTEPRLRVVLRQRRRNQLASGHRRRRRSQQDDRQGHRQTHLPRRQLRADHQSGSGREQDRRRDDLHREPSHQTEELRFQQDARDQPRLGHLPDPTLQRCPRGHTGDRSTA